jgi:hypothetical protein
MAQAGAYRLPIVVAISHYFHGLDQTLDSEFIHNWIAAESLAKTICSGPEFGSTPENPPLVRDQSAWREWVKSNRQALHDLANPDEADRLYNRVMNMSQRDGKVDRAFRVLGLRWVPAMNDVQDIRNFAIHEGVIAGLASPASREWEQDRRRIGLIKTMVTALLAKIIGYTGPIADREKTSFSIASSDLPQWWEHKDKLKLISYQGTGTPTMEEIRASLRNFEALGGQFSDPVG